MFGPCMEFLMYEVFCLKIKQFLSHECLSILCTVSYTVEIWGNYPFHAGCSCTAVFHIYCTVTLVCFRVTKEHRENLAKNAKALFIKCRDSIRDVQNKYLKTVKNDSTISQDLSHNIQDQVSHICVKCTRSAKNSGFMLLKDIHTFLGVHTESQLCRQYGGQLFQLRGCGFLFVPPARFFPSIPHQLPVFTAVTIYMLQN